MNPALKDLPDGLHVTREDHVVIVFFDRPERKNAITRDMWKAIPGIVEYVVADPDIRILAFAGATPDVFSAGADIQEFREVRVGEANATAYSDAVRAAESAIIDCPKPTAAFIRGWCVGGGAEIAVACDLRLADTTARIGVTPAKLGIVYGQLSTTRLVQELGASAARYLLMTARILDAEAALRIGLVQELHEPPNADQAWRDLLAAVCSGAPITLAGAKYLTSRAVQGEGAEDAMADSWYRRSYRSEEYKRGVSAFAAKNKPDFSDLPWPAGR